MATKGALGTLFVVLVLAAVSAVLLMGFIASTQSKAQAATESGTFQKVRQVYLVQTADLPDLKLEDVDSAKCIKQGGPYSPPYKLEMHFAISNRGEADASVAEPGIGVCSDEAMLVSDYACAGRDVLCCPAGAGVMNSYCTEKIIELYGDPQITDLRAHERITSIDTFTAVVNSDHCPGAFKFKPYVCAGGIEELNDENNYLYKIGSKQNNIICTSPSCRLWSRECNYGCREYIA